MLDEKGEGIPGASVIVKGTFQGTVTDIDGNFEIELPEGYSSLEFRATGWESLVHKIKDTGQPLVVTLCDEQVIEAARIYGSRINKGDLPSVVISGRPVTDITKALEGSVGGVSSYAIMGIPPSSPDILLRGNPLSQPLIILNGKRYAGSITDINPNTIKKLKVLKDAEAKTKYGEKGANGVIVVDTKDITFWRRITKPFRKK